MAQITDGLALTDCKLEYGTVGGTTGWNDMSGHANSITHGGGEVPVGEGYTFEGDDPILKAGKHGPHTLNVGVVYSDGTSTPYPILLGYKENKTPFYLRYSPAGGTTGDRQFTTGAGYITNLPLPSGDAQSGDLVTLEMVCKFTTITAADAS